MDQRSRRRVIFDLDCLLTKVRSMSNDKYLSTHTSGQRLFHYTRSGAAWQILTDDRLLLFDIATMNDSSEVDFYLDHVERAFQRYGPEHRHATIVGSALKRAMRWRDTHHIMLISMAEAAEGANEVFSSEDYSYRMNANVERDLAAADSLLLWRGYAREGSGVAIEFGRGDSLLRHALFLDETTCDNYVNRFVRGSSSNKSVNDYMQAGALDELRQSVARLGPDDSDLSYVGRILDFLEGRGEMPTILGSDTWLGECLYSSGYRISESWDLVLKDIVCAIDKEFAGSEPPDWIEPLIARFFLALAVMHKHPGFADEREWRLVRLLTKDDPSVFRFGPLGRKRACTEVPLGLALPQLDNPVDPMTVVEVSKTRPLEVVLGPAFPRGNLPAAIAALERNGKIHVSRSRIPFLG